MKICTITCHDVCNYGASLQAFALQSYLHKQGHDVKIIDYKPPYQKAYKFTTDVSKDSQYYHLYKKYPLLKWIKACKNYIESRKTIGRKRAFESFKNQYLSLTKRYESYKELVAMPPSADVYIAGSDQVWSTFLPNGSDPAFYMQFGTLETKRISYAASFAFSNVYGGYDIFVKSMLSNLDAISVRELSGLNILTSLELSGVQVVDPVFLLSAKEWVNDLELERMTNQIKGKYILCYDLRATSGLKERAIALSREYNLPIVSLNDRISRKYANINVNNAGPLDFLKLIFDAEYIITDSFHATSFSVIFRKRFWSYFDNQKNTRIKDFLELVHLSDRMNRNDNICEIAWDVVYNQLNNTIESSKSFLTNNIDMFND